MRLDPPRTRIPVPDSRFDVFAEEQLTAYLRTQGIRVVESRGHLWRNAAAPSPIARQDWTPLHRFVPLTRDEARFPLRSALAYRCLAAEPVPTTFPYVVVRDIPNYDERRMTKDHARHVRRALERFEFVWLDSPDLLLEQGWQVASAAAAESGMVIARHEGEYRKQTIAMFDAPPIVIAGLSEGRLAGYVTTYATGAEAVFEKIYIAPEFRKEGVGRGLYWNVLAGWAQTPGVQNVWTGGTLPQRGVDRFKVSMGAVLEEVPVHAGMRAPLAMALRRLRPTAISLGALNG